MAYRAHKIPFCKKVKKAKKTWLILQKNQNPKKFKKKNKKKQAVASKFVKKKKKEKGFKAIWNSSIMQKNEGVLTNLV